MFENLSENLLKSLRKISGKSHLSDDNIKKTLKEVRNALIEADVALPVVRHFISNVKENALGKEVSKSLTPGQEFIKIIRIALVNAIGGDNSLNLSVQPPAVILITGPQGVGKTTSIGKLSKYLYELKKKKILVVSADIYRPAAIQQLATLSKNAGVDFFNSDPSQDPIDIVNKALITAKIKFYDILLVDTAGRLHIDQVMMDEIVNIHNALNPVETLFVVDAMTGQDAANTAKAFNKALPLTGIILTKVDGDTRGGAALSIRYITGKSIKFIGVGEKIDALSPFYPERIANRILGMDDVLSIIEDIEKKVNKSSVKKIATKFKKGEKFDLYDFLEQIKQVRNMGGINKILHKLPGISQLKKKTTDKIDSKLLIHMEAIINSMTKKERLNPDVIKGSRKRRIAIGSGVQVQDVNRLLKQFDTVKRTFKKIKKGGILKTIRTMKGIMPPSFFSF